MACAIFYTYQTSGACAGVCACNRMHQMEKNIFGKNGTSTQSNKVSCVRDFLVFFSVFVGEKVTVNENVSFTDHASGIRLPNCSKLAINRKNGNGVTICRHDVISNFFWRVLFLLSSLVSYWFKFNVKIITGSGVTTIFF